MKKKSQHYISKFYLKNFIDENSKHLPNPYIWVFEREKPLKPYRKSPDNIAYESNFYSLSDDDEKLRTLIEDEFQKLESSTAPVIRKIISCVEENLTDEDRAILSEFIVYANTRVPSFRESHDQTQEDLLKLMMATMAESEERLESIIKGYEEDTGNKLNADIKGLREFMLSDRYDIKIPRQSSLGSMLKVTPDLIQYPFKMCWEFLVAPKNVYFITSDNPVVLTFPNRKPSIYGVGYLTKKVHLLFPLCPRICLMARWKRKKNYRYTQVTSDMVRWVNEEISSYSTNYVFASKNKFYLPGRVIE